MADYWRGSEYGRTNILGGARLFVLGEAHYHDAPIGTLIPNITNDVVEAHIADKMGSAATFFRRIERLVTKRYSRGLAPDERRQFWNSVVFSNYIPVIVGNAPGDRPSDAHWDGSAGAEFVENVTRTEAEIVLVCGTTLWRRKPVHRAISNAYQVKDRGFEGHEINWSPDWGAVAAHIPHPSGSRGWSYERCAPAVDYLFSSMNQRRSNRGVPHAIPSIW